MEMGGRCDGVGLGTRTMGWVSGCVRGPDLRVRP